MRSFKMIDVRACSAVPCSGCCFLSRGQSHAEEAAEAAEPTPADDLQVNQANSLEELLDNVRERRVVESRAHTEREQRFRAG